MVADKKSKSTRCPICKLEEEERSSVELLAVVSCSTWRIAATRIQNTFGIEVSPAMLRKHMTEHPLCTVPSQQGIILDAIKGEDGAPGVISIETMLQTLLIQGMLDLAKGKIRCKTPQDLMQVTNMLQQVQDRKNARALIEEGDISGFYAAMAAYGTAIRDTVSPQQLAEIVAKANALGAGFDIGNARYEDVIDVDPEAVMQLAVEDYRKLGRGRTRDELIESGAIDEMFAGVELPD